jgi:hypothetical protein
MQCSTTETVFSISACLFLWEYNEIIWIVIAIFEKNPVTGIKFHTAFQPWNEHESETNTKSTKIFHIQVNAEQQKRITFVYLWKTAFFT